MAARLPSITIIRDTREQKGWDFEPEEKLPGKVQCLGTIETTLDAGDYSILGYEDEIVIERKQGFCELFGNMSPKEHKERFEREMEKLRNVRYKYLIVEGILTHDVLGMSIPQFTKSPPTSAVIRWLFSLQMEYGIVPIFAGECGKKAARYIFEQFVRRQLQ